jgi:hypothetical protein
MIQVVVTPAEVPCQHCQSGCGPFARCIRIPGSLGPCSNCHWNSHRARCCFDRTPNNAATTYIPREFRQHHTTVRDLREQKGQLTGIRAEASDVSTSNPQI